MVTLSIGICSPLSQDDHDLLTGMSIMLLAIANRPMAEQRFPEAFADETTAGDEAAGPPTPDPTVTAETAEGGGDR